MKINKFAIHYLLNLCFSRDFIDNATVEEIYLAKKFKKITLNEENFYPFNFFDYAEQEKLFNKEEFEKINNFIKSLKDEGKEASIEALIIKDELENSQLKLKEKYKEFINKIVALSLEEQEVSDEFMNEEIKQFLFDLVRNIKNENSQIKLVLSDFLDQLKSTANYPKG